MPGKLSIWKLIPFGISNIMHEGMTSSLTIFFGKSLIKFRSGIKFIIHGNYI